MKRKRVTEEMKLDIYSESNVVPEEEVRAVSRCEAEDKRWSKSNTDPRATRRKGEGGASPGQGS